MSLRTRVVVSVFATGRAVPHGLPTTPDEYAFSPLDAAGATAIFFSSVPVDATNVNLTGSVAGTVAVFAAVNHSIVK